ncbi:MAG: hypothetical protein NT138_06660 [Planctomycetales bacterium]|nr:hypothetical protein [Planctomycetales bacterium]
MKRVRGRQLYFESFNGKPQATAKFSVAQQGQLVNRRTAWGKQSPSTTQQYHFRVYP